MWYDEVKGTAGSGENCEIVRLERMYWQNRARRLGIVIGPIEGSFVDEANFGLKEF